jgi:hypothetical protein
MNNRGRLSFLVVLLAILLVVLAVLPQSRFFLTGIVRMEPWYLGQPASYWEQALKAEIQAHKKWEQNVSQNLQAARERGSMPKWPSTEVKTRLEEGGENAFPVLVELLKVPDAEFQQKVTWMVFRLQVNSQEMADSLASTLRFRTDRGIVGKVMGKVMDYDRATGLAALRDAIANNPDQNMRDHCESILAARYEKNETAKQTPRADEDDEKPAAVKTSRVTQDAGEDEATGSSVSAAIRQSPSSSSDWNPAMAVRAVNRLQALGRADAIAELRKFSEDYDRVSLILRLLFEVDHRSEAQFLLILQNDVPFCLTGGGMRMGRPSDPLEYLGRGPFLPLRAKQLHPADDPIAAIDKLLALPQTTELLSNSEWSRAGLRRQAWLAIAPLLSGASVRSNPDHAEFMDEEWEARKREAAKAKTYWDVEKQDYAVKK